ncbi:MAG: glutamate formimidoyltransferase [Pseudomonadota bacterium]
MKIVECVPNFSEGRDQNIIQAIASEIERSPDARLIDVDPGADTNRTVVTMVGPPEAIKEAAFRAIRKAAELLDMRKHRGAHPRLGATDVCPFVPVSGVTMDECAELARSLGARVAAELGIPVFLYEEAASRPERRNLANIRQGEYEGLAEKLKDPEWAPDFGEPVFNPRAGATVIGAREFLIAYNVNLNTRDAKLASQIAANLRESGKPQRDEQGAIVRDEDGNKVMIPGSLKSVKAGGWFISRYGLAQVTMNITNYKITPMHTAFEQACAEAEKLGLRVTGSEIVGVVPREAMLQAGCHFLEKQGKSAGQPERDLIDAAILSLGLSQVSPFDATKKIIEYRIETPGPLVSQTVRSFVDELSTDSATPGGGSVAALTGALGAGLAAMVANLTIGKKSYRDVEPEMRQIAAEAQELKDELLRSVDNDARAFDKVMEAMRLPKGSEEERALRQQALDHAYLGAVMVPMGVLRRAVLLEEQARAVAQKGFKPSLSDAGVAALAGRAAAEGAFYNILINLGSMSADPSVAEIARESEDLLQRVVAAADVVARLVREGLATGHQQ